MNEAAPYRILIVGNPPALEFDLGGEVDTRRGQVDQATDVEMAANMLSTGRYDVVLVDFAGQCSEDIQPVRRLRSVTPDVKVILFVENSMPEQVIDAIRSHAFSYFSKPCDPHAVQEMIRQALTVRGWSDGIELMSADVRYLSLRLRCRHLTADRLMQFMQELPIDLPADERSDVAQAFREMLLNGIEHGGKMNENEWVRVSRIRTQRSLVYHIQDPGSGFSRGSGRQPGVYSQDDPLGHIHYRMQAGIRPGGFGMLIVTQLVDEVIYNEQGNEVILIKYLD